MARISKASPRLFLSAATGVHHKFAALTGVRASGKKQNEFLKYKLSDVAVTSLQQSDDPTVAPTERFSLSYSKFEITFTPISSRERRNRQSKAGLTSRPTRSSSAQSTTGSRIPSSINRRSTGSAALARST